ncbi:MAG: SsrA-binding protein [Candidatus Blackburnbacteria bacterium RIFCSPHIGHO2_01_FULL_43_15b]|uniref:SsrA-binding protein n=1 Tax=Candidatus Blackburnbacteria bacterium RIFCSPHIGHO2_01_FULL_43_15b TaxID=1797513 RepID=A0A1G1V3L7_9BACT|nr:MAG: SsrA-binding protein [Candidatus Blackburnbacteria bacterium RIFCSPHIGHO2_01_FULL_43_15b]
MKILNKRARRDYQILETFEAGICLLGTEAKALRAGRGDINSAYGRVKDSEAYLVGANIPAHITTSVKDYDPLRTRKLLLHKKELLSLSTRIKQQNLNLIPLCLYNKGPLVKVQLALARSKKQFEKKEAKKRRDIAREAEVEARGKW